jgi:uncharacterized membrane protein
MTGGAMIDWGIVARAVHILAVVAWIGGVWMVTTVLLPGLRGRPDGGWLREFEAIEARFAPQVRIAVLLVLLSGLYMLQEYSLWDRFADARFWWMHLMVALWALFALMLFVIEPLLARRLKNRHGGVTLSQMLWMHRVLLLLSLATIFAAVGGSHGLF